MIVFFFCYLAFPASSRLLWACCAACAASPPKPKTSIINTHASIKHIYIYIYIYMHISFSLSLSLYIYI